MDDETRLQLEVSPGRQTPVRATLSHALLGPSLIQRSLGGEEKPLAQASWLSVGKACTRSRSAGTSGQEPLLFLSHQPQPGEHGLHPIPQGAAILCCKWVPSLLTFPFYYSLQGLQGLSPGDSCPPGSPTPLSRGTPQSHTQKYFSHRTPGHSASVPGLCNLLGGSSLPCQFHAVWEGAISFLHLGDVCRPPGTHSKGLVGVLRVPPIYASMPGPTRVTR